MQPDQSETRLPFVALGDLLDPVGPEVLATLPSPQREALVLVQPVLLVYAAVVGLAMASFVYGYEEPTLSARFSAEYETYAAPSRPGGPASARGIRIRSTDDLARPLDHA